MARLWRMPFVAGQQLSFHEILGPLGAGATGEFHRAEDTRLDQPLTYDRGSDFGSRD